MFRVKDDAINVRAIPPAVAFLFVALQITSSYEAINGVKDGGATAVHLSGHFNLAAATPTIFICVASEDAQYLQVTRLQCRICRSSCRNDG